MLGTKKKLLINCLSGKDSNNMFIKANQKSHYYSDL